MCLFYSVLLKFLRGVRFVFGGVFVSSGLSKDFAAALIICSLLIVKNCLDKQLPSLKLTSNASQEDQALQSGDLHLVKRGLNEPILEP